MFTYVINTSENKTFDSDQLFKLVGYNKICWMNYPLDELEKCVEEIGERQTALGADDFRIAILVDFYGFKRVRNLYGSEGYSASETGVDLSLYFPFIEAYIADHLFAPIRKKELVIKERHVFYIQNGKHDDFSIIRNDVQQVKYILEPDEECVTEVISVKVPVEEMIRRKKEQEERELEKKGITDAEREELRRLYELKRQEMEELSSDEDFLKEQEKMIAERQEEVDRQEEIELKEQFGEEEEDKKKKDKEKKNQVSYVEVPEKRYSQFNLYCTENLALTFKMSDYPYTNKKGLTFEEFYREFKQRVGVYNGIKRHYYYASFGSGIAKAAFDNLSLSLYIIKMYEREEAITDTEELVIGRIDPDALKNTLITSWNKICSARALALNNSSTYCDIKNIKFDGDVKKEERQKEIRLDFESESQAEAKKMSTEAMYEEICRLYANGTGKMTEEDTDILNGYVSTYLEKRDSLTEESDSVQFDLIKESCNKVNMCPSRHDYENEIAKKKAQIANVLKETMNAEYQTKGYDDQKEKADEEYVEYLKIKRSLGKAVFGDLLIWAISMIVMMVPFIAINGFNFIQGTFYLLTAGVFTGLFAIAFMVRILPLVAKLKKKAYAVKKCFIECRKRQKEALINYKDRYETELLSIEHLRYDLRNITRLYNYNIAKNKNIEQHREKLESVENQLSAMLNNLGVEPVVVKYSDLSEEFDVNKSYMSNANRIYKIFSIETIEGLFGGTER